MSSGIGVQIIVSEPWDFTSAEGDNKFSGKILESVHDNNVGMRNLIKVKSPFHLSNLFVEYVITVPRQKGNNKNINVYYISEEVIRSGDFWINIENEICFIAIGSM